MVRDYSAVLSRIDSLIEDENDLIALMATVVCELHNEFKEFHWTGFYRVTSPGLLKIGPYQGTHGCLEISFDRGVCGACASSKMTQLVPNVHDREDHIACSSSTLSEIVVPMLDQDGEVIAVLDIDSDNLAEFDEHDQRNLESICALISSKIR